MKGLIDFGRRERLGVEPSISGSRLRLSNHFIASPRAVFSLFCFSVATLFILVHLFLCALGADGSHIGCHFCEYGLIGREDWNYSQQYCFSLTQNSCVFHMNAASWRFAYELQRSVQVGGRWGNCWRRLSTFSYTLRVARSEMCTNQRWHWMVLTFATLMLLSVLLALPVYRFINMLLWKVFSLFWITLLCSNCSYLNVRFVYGCSGNRCKLCTWRFNTHFTVHRANVLNSHIMRVGSLQSGRHILCLRQFRFDTCNELMRWSKECVLCT